MDVMKLDGRRIVFDGESMTVHVRFYDVGGRPRIDVLTDIEPFGTFTVNDPETPLAENEVLIKTWSENEPYYQTLYATGWFEDTGRRVPMGFCVAQVWRVL